MPILHISPVGRALSEWCSVVHRLLIEDNRAKHLLLQFVSGET